MQITKTLVIVSLCISAGAARAAADSAEEMKAKLDRSTAASASRSSRMASVLSSTGLGSAKDASLSRRSRSMGSLNSSGNGTFSTASAGSCPGCASFTARHGGVAYTKQKSGSGHSSSAGASPSHNWGPHYYEPDPDHSFTHGYGNVAYTKQKSGSGRSSYAARSSASKAGRSSSVSKSSRSGASRSAKSSSVSKSSRSSSSSRAASRGSKGSGAYDGLIKKYASKYGLSPNLVKSVMAQESSFNPKARSKVGAQGLMQVMPKTGAWMAKKMGLKGKLNLYNPETSINIGCAYLKYLKGRKGGGSATGILRGYNGGPRRMYKPSKQTSAYASQVQRRRNTVK